MTDARDALVERERIRGASRMIPEGTDPAAVTDEQIQSVAADVELFAKQHKINRKELARSIGYSPSVVSEFIAGKYAGNRGQLAIELESWLVEEEKRRTRPTTNQFVWTKVAMQIKAVATYALDYRKIAMVYGPDTSGVGKTTSLKAILQEMGPRRAALVTIDKVDANPTGMLRKLCHAAQVEESGSNRQRFERIVQKLSGRSFLLILDQIHNLRWSKDDKPFYILTDLYDATQTAQLWCGTSDLLNYLQRQQARSADESLAQIRRRIFPIVDLMQGVRPGEDGNGEPLITVEQVREMFARNKLKLTSAAAKFLYQLAHIPDGGAVGLCVQLVEYATMLAEMKNLSSIDVPLIQEAMRRGFNPDRADLLLRNSGEAQQRISKAG